MENFVDKLIMHVQETQDEFIFSTISKYIMDNFQIVIKKDELIRAISLIRLSKEYGPGIDERWATATQQAEVLSREYRRGFQDGMKKEHDRIQSYLDSVYKEDTPERYK